MVTTLERAPGNADHVPAPVAARYRRPVLIAVLAVVALLAAGLAGYWSGGGFDDDSNSNQASTAAIETVLDLQGTWSNGPTTLTLTHCAVGKECGLLERIGGRRTQCVYELVYRSQDVDGFNFETSKGKNFECDYSRWSESVMHLTPRTDDTIKVVAGGDASTYTTLRRAAN